MHQQLAPQVIMAGRELTGLSRAELARVARELELQDSPAADAVWDVALVVDRRNRALPTWLDVESHNEGALIA